MLDEVIAWVEKTVHGVPLSKETFRVPPRELGIFTWFGMVSWIMRKWNTSSGNCMPREYRIFIPGRFGLDVAPICPMNGLNGCSLPSIKQRNWACRSGFTMKELASGTVGLEIPPNILTCKRYYLELVILDFNGPFFTYLEGMDSATWTWKTLNQSAPTACGREEFEAGRFRKSVT